MCSNHGASSPQAKAAAARRVAEAKAAAQLGRLIGASFEPVREPVRLLATMVAEADEWRRVAAEKVNELRELRFTDAKGVEQLNATVSLYERSLDRTAKFAESLVRLDIEDRLVRVEETQAAALLTVLQRALSAAVPNGAQRAEVLTLVAAGLRDLGASA